MKSSTSYLSSSVLVGLLKREGPNLINVLSLSKEAGITVLQHFFRNYSAIKKKKKSYMLTESLGEPDPL